MRFFWLISWLTFTPFILNAQSALPPVYEITTDTAYLQMVDSTYWQKLEDKEGKWTFEEVRKEPLAGKFHIKGTKAAGIDTIDIGTYWHRYRLKNAMSQNAEISLTSPADFFDVYIIKEDSSISHYRSGVLRNWDEKDGMKIADRGGAIPLVLKPGEVITVYDRRNKKDEKNFRTSVRFLSTEKIEKKYIDIVDSRSAIYSKLHLQEAFMLGMLLLSTIFSAFLFRVTKEKVYLYFTLFAFFVAINRLWNIANIYTNWFEPQLNHYVGYLGYAWIFIPFFLLLFIRTFFDCKLRYPKWNKVLIALGLLQISIGLIDLITNIFKINFTRIVDSMNGIIVFFLVPLAILITVLLYLRSKNQAHRIVAIGSLPYMLWFIATVLVGPEAILWDSSSLAISKWLGNNFRLIEMTTLGWLIICFTWVLFLRFSQLRKENAQQALDKEKLAREKEVERNDLIEKQKVQLEIEVEERTLALKQSIENLKATQSQLIQSEKMASLGELTAGIAHEIQNPLNFVNNFSDVSNELLDEMMEAIAQGNYEEAKSLVDDVKQNLEKINYHGKRADGIVKGMLQHSRSSNGIKEPTDINSLADEYLRLAYHGLRAKDKSFNATMKTAFDESIGNIQLIPQDVGRVLLNLFTNAFYAVTDKKKQGIDGYNPTVTVTSKKFDDRIEINVKDNGNGIPQQISDKIFQPFFTTKPTGQGTGLGLSMSYDIITKGHGGTLKLNSKDGEFAEFTIILPN